MVDYIDSRMFQKWIGWGWLRRTVAGYRDDGIYFGLLYETIFLNTPYDVCEID